jgi:hypothetical protein
MDRQAEEFWIKQFNDLARERQIRQQQQLYAKILKHKISIQAMKQFRRALGDLTK